MSRIFGTLICRTIPKKKPLFKALFKSKGYTYYGSKKLIEKAQWHWPLLKQIKK